MIQTSGIQSGMNLIQSSASALANANTKPANSSQPTDLSEAMTTQIRGEHQVQANSTAIKTEDSMLGTLLDLKS